ncbi:hypothetical protein B0H17DRAFT_937218, partial [Mycena rosella]
SEAKRVNLKRCFTKIMELMEDPRGVHPKVAKVLENTCSRVERVRGDISMDKRRQKNPHTWQDNNENTMYLD